MKRLHYCFLLFAFAALAVFGSIPPTCSQTLPYDAFDGLHYVIGARHYDPLAGRFTSADPMGHSGSMDLYSFAGGDPVNFFDPDGRFGKQTTADSGDSEMSAPESGFQPPDDQELGAERSALINAIPGVGTLKEWWELNTGKDAFTGEWLEGNDCVKALGIVVNLLPVAAGPAGLLEGGGENALFESVDQGLGEAGASEATFVGAGERGLIEIGETETAAAADNIITVDFTQGEKAAVGATYNPGDIMPNAQVAGVGPGAMYTGEASAGAAPSVLNAVAEKSLQLPATDATLTGTGTRTLGYTTSSGDIFLQPGLSRAEQLSTLRHESVHAFFSPQGNGAVATFRQNLGQWGYDNSQLLRFTEEATAETYSSGSLLQGLSHPLVNGYGITPGGLLLEGGAVGGGLLGVGYFGYEMGGGGR